MGRKTEGTPDGTTDGTRQDLEVPPSAAGLSMRELLRDIRGDAGVLVKKEIELARAELREDLRTQALTVGGFGVAGLGAVVGIILLLVTAVFALAQVMPAWGAGLIVSGAVLVASAIVGFVGWNQRVRKPLEKTRASLKESLRWTRKTRENLA
jgi:hypothetical protein